MPLPHRLPPLALLVLALAAPPDLAAAPTPSGPSARAGDGAPMPAPGGQPADVAVRRLRTRTPRRIDVRSPGFDADAHIPLRHTAYGDDLSPPLEWDAVDGARAYALIVEDPDAPRERPFVHWLAWNIPDDSAGLPEAIETVREPVDIKGLRQGRNDRGEIGYFGPRPPAGDAPHRYHLQLFALDRELELPAGADRDALLAALDGRVIATGELVATAQAPRRQ